ncbi:MAG: CotH kinase family protein, partial [Planctomycetota bacterium]
EFRNRLDAVISFSPLSKDISRKPAGSPCARNASFSKTLPPSVSDPKVSESIVTSGHGIPVEATVKGSGADLKSVELLYRVVNSGSEGEEVALPMAKRENGTYEATVPSQKANQIVRVRVRATDAAGAVRYAPSPNDLRPAVSVLVAEPVSTGKIPVFQFFNIGEAEFDKAKRYLENQKSSGSGRGRFSRFGRGRGGFDRGGRDRREGGDRDRSTRERQEPRGGEADERRRDDRGGGERRGSERGRSRSRGDWRRFFGSREPDPRPAHGRSAFVYTDAKTGKSQFFDFVHISERKSGYKVRLQKDRPLDGMTTLNVLYERDERSILTESPAYEVYRLAGNASPNSGYARVMIDGQLAGYHLWFEQMNGAFFRRNGMSRGSLYKIIWMGTNRASRHTPKDKIPERRDIVGRHEKKTNPHGGYKDVVDLIELIERSKEPDVLWSVIEKRFDVEQVINYFAVNTLLSHWDGFFNNYFLHRDGKSGKWRIFPWDQDSTWGHRMNRGGEVFAEMPLTFGMEGDVPPGTDPNSTSRRSRFGFGFGGRGASWWRPGGELSKPLLANPEFRKRYLARVKVLAETVCTEEVFGPKLDGLRADLEPEVRLRAKAKGKPEDEAVSELERSLGFLREHLVKRREFLLREIKNQAK